MTDFRQNTYRRSDNSKNKEFVHLHCHTEYSLNDSLLNANHLARLAKDFGMSAVAMTDHGNIFGVIEFDRMAKKAGIKPIFGMEANVVSEPILKDSKDRIITHMTLLAASNKGYPAVVGYVYR